MDGGGGRGGRRGCGLGVKLGVRRVGGGRGKGVIRGSVWLERALTHL